MTNREIAEKWAIEYSNIADKRISSLTTYIESAITEATENAKACSIVAQVAGESAWNIPLPDPPHDYTDDGSALCLLADAEDAIEEAITEATQSQQKVITEIEARQKASGEREREHQQRIAELEQLIEKHESLIVTCSGCGLRSYPREARKISLNQVIQEREAQNHSDKQDGSTNRKGE